MPTHFQPSVLITGASRGIGRACALAFAQKGYALFLNYHSQKSAAELLAREIESMYSVPAVPFQADVSCENQVKAMVQEMAGRFGHIDVLVNNAGIAQQKLFTDITAEDWKRMFDVNIGGMFHCCKAVLPYMIHEKKGKIINISSIWGMVGASCEVHYSASKAAVLGFTKALAKEEGLSGIQVNCVAPGVVGTEMNATLDEDTLASIREETPLNTIGTPEDIARTVLFLASKGADFITGQVISPNGGFVIC